jgi:hypothetical protein
MVHQFAEISLSDEQKIGEGTFSIVYKTDLFADGEMRTVSTGRQ